jgi:hypothetical protein
MECVILCTRRNYSWELQAKTRRKESYWDCLFRAHGPGTMVDGGWQNDRLSFTLKFDKHESIAITGYLQDGKIVGEFRTEGFVSNWEAKKKLKCHEQIVCASRVSTGKGMKS